MTVRLSTAGGLARHGAKRHEQGAAWGQDAEQHAKHATESTEREWLPNHVQEFPAVQDAQVARVIVLVLRVEFAGFGIQPMTTTPSRAG